MAVYQRDSAECCWAPAWATNGLTLRICVYLVGLVIFLPFTTKAISDPDPAGLPLPTAVYAANVAAVVVLTIALQLAGRWRGLTDGQEELLPQITGAVAVAAVFAVSIPVAYRYGPDTAMRSWLSLLVISPVVGLITRELSRSRTRPPRRAAGPRRRPR